MEPGPDGFGGAQDEVTDLVQDLDAFIDCGSAGDHQHPDGFDVAVTMLRLAGCGSAQRGSRRCDGVDRVGLAVAVTGLTVWSIDLDHSDAFAAQVSAEPGAIGAGAFDTDAVDRPETLQPGNELGVAGASGRGRFDAEHTAVRVDRGRNMELEVGVDPAGDLGVILYDGHGHHLRQVNRVGTHLPGRWNTTP
jgi:hypothetical protein